MLSLNKKNAVGYGAQANDKGAKASPLYTNKFFEMRQVQTCNAARCIVPKVLEMIKPRSVVDVGCGTGQFLAAFSDFGVEDILGIDGAYMQPSLLVIPQHSFMPLDLNQPFLLESTYDLAVCLEVAEHLQPQHAEVFVASLTRLAPVILFSAAIPYQGGTGHVNEQWAEYWADLFKQHGFVPVDALRRSIWHESEIPFWYRQNILFYCTKEALANNEKLAAAYKATDPNVLSCVHPLLYLECNSKYLLLLRHILPYLSSLWHVKENKEKIKSRLGKWIGKWMGGVSYE